MTKYAERTNVSPSRSRDEIRDTLKRFGATDMRYYEDEERATIGFVAEGIQVAISLPMHGTAQEVASRWRTLGLAIKAKLSLIECGGSTFEHEFFSDIQLPSGRTVHEEFAGRALALSAGKAPAIEAKIVELPNRASS